MSCYLDYVSLMIFLLIEEKKMLPRYKTSDLSSIKHCRVYLQPREAGPVLFKPKIIQWLNVFSLWKISERDLTLFPVNLTTFKVPENQPWFHQCPVSLGGQRKNEKEPSRLMLCAPSRESNGL